MKKILSAALFMSFAALLVVLSADVANAQPRWARGRQRVAVDNTIRRLENETDRFVRELDRALDRTRMDGTRRENNIMTQARDLERDTDELRREFNRFGDTWWETRSNVSKVVNSARRVNSLMRDRRLNNLTRNSWRAVQREVNALAGYYGLPRV